MQECSPGSANGVPPAQAVKLRRHSFWQEAGILDLQTTIVTLILAGAAVGWATWRARKPYVPGDPPLIPYGLLQFVGMVIVFLMAAHLITLLTGKPFTGRRG